MKHRRITPECNWPNELEKNRGLAKMVMYTSVAKNRRPACQSKF
jgi:hypothetical protein